MRRRALLTTVAVSAIAGCLDRGQSGSPTENDEPSAADETPPRTETPTPLQRFESVPPNDVISDVGTPAGLEANETGTSARVRLEPGEYTRLGFQVIENTELDVTGQVTKGAPIDLYVMTGVQYNEYRREPNVVPAAAAIESVTSIDLTRGFSDGNYVLVFDNTYQGETSPSGPAEATFDFVLRSDAESDSGTPANT
ncbi:hypothetical protein ACFR9U_12660 [Halorientalis brevis]|uniref:Lipoprotein n=1 Tax=Halorientalis brevis TaxID=1126241 RepID=A0ABD6CDV4_9EURY|nr:hypothetical protein [Halorientalis brevis]